MEVFAMTPPAAFAGQAEREARFRLVFSDGREETATFPLLGPAR